MSARKGRLALILAASFLMGCLVFFLCFRFDNKYTQPRPYARQGVTSLDMEWYDSHPFFYLADGWALYRDKLLTPEELPAHAPDAYLYLGQYGGFDLGDPAAAPHGQGTYRAVIQLDGRPRTFALELPPIFSRWNLWVNGTLVQSVGMEEAPPSARSGRMAVFTASEQIEIVAAVADDSGFYSGMVYPPALGSPRAVGLVGDLRLLLHGAACAVALALGLLCLLLALGAPALRRRPLLPLALLCLCFCGTASWPILQALGLESTGWTLAERLFHYGMFPALIWVQGRVCGLPKRALLPALGAGWLAWASVLLQPLFRPETAAPLMACAVALAAWKWLCAGWLVGTGLWCALRGRPGSRTLLGGGGFFAAALVMDKLLPLHEPILLGWFIELAGGVMTLLAAGLVWRDTLETYRADAALRTELAVRAEHAQLQQDYVRQTRERLHEDRSHITLMTHYLDAGELDKLRAYLAELAPGGGDPGQYTGDPLVDAILSVELARADREGIYVELDLPPLSGGLPCADADLTSLLMNLLDNALEANARLPEGTVRWLRLELVRRENALELICRNAAPPPEGAGTSKADRRAHGFGLPLLRKIAAKYGGTLTVDRLDDCCAVTVTLGGAAEREEVAR